MKKNISGFTIVELLIVIVVIAILAAISVVAYNGMQERAKASAASNDIGSLVKAIHLARNSADKTLIAITGNGCTACSCPYAGGDTTPYYSLPKSHACWVNYYSTLNTISVASGVNLDGIKSGDPWGSPYFIDENENEGGRCNKDTVRSTGRSGNINGGTSFGIAAIPFYQCT